MTQLRPEKVYIKHADRREVSEFSLYLGMTPVSALLQRRILQLLALRLAAVSGPESG